MAAESPHTASAKKKTLKKKKKPSRKQYFDIGVSRFVMGFKNSPASTCLTTTILKSNYGCIFDQLSKLLASELCAPARLDPDLTIHFAEKFEAINYSASKFKPIVEKYVPRYNAAAKKFRTAFPKLTPVFWVTEPKSVNKDKALHLLISKKWRMAYSSLRPAAKESALKPEITDWIKAASASYTHTPKPRSKSKKPNPNSNSNNTHIKPLIRRGSMSSAEVPAPCPKSVKKRAKSMGSIFDEHCEQKDPARDDSSTAPLSEISNSEADFDRELMPPIFEFPSIASKSITESLADDFPDEPNTMLPLPDKLSDPDKIEDADELQQFFGIPRLAEGEGQITVKNQSEKENLGEKDESEKGEYEKGESEKGESEKGESEKNDSEKDESEKDEQEDEEVNWHQYSKIALVDEMKLATITVKELKIKFHKERNKAYQAKNRWTEKAKEMGMDLELEKKKVSELKKKLKKARRNTGSGGMLSAHDEAKRVKQRMRPTDITRLIVMLAKDNADAVSRIVAGEKKLWMRRVEKQCKQERDSWKNKVHWTITLELSGTTKRQHQAFRNALNTKKICQNKSGAQYIYDSDSCA